MMFHVEQLNEFRSEKLELIRKSYKGKALIHYN